MSIHHLVGISSKSEQMHADDKLRWQKVLELYVEGCVIRGTIVCAVKCGLIVKTEDGIDAFLPVSQVDVNPIKDLHEYIGRTLDFEVIKISNERKNIILSRRKLLCAGWKDRQIVIKRKGIVMAPGWRPMLVAVNRANGNAFTIKSKAWQNDVAREPIQTVVGAAKESGVAMDKCDVDEFEW